VGVVLVQVFFVLQLEVGVLYCGDDGVGFGELVVGEYVVVDEVLLFDFWVEVVFVSDVVVE